MSKKLPELFLEYSKSHPGLVRQSREFVHYLSGGMAVKFMLKAKRVAASSLVKKTTDFDFVFAVPDKLSEATMLRKFKLMDKMMSRHVFGFERWLKTVHKIDARVIKFDLVPPILYSPITKKRIFRVIQYKVHIYGQKPEGLVDATLVHIPGIKTDQILDDYTAKFGMPIQHLKYLYKGVMHVLAGSFSSFADKDPSLKSRNPLIGNRKEKGLKNAARIKNLMKAQTVASTAAKSFIRHINKGNVKAAYKAANVVLKNISK
jgi:hypothetical protein